MWSIKNLNRNIWNLAFFTEDNLKNVLEGDYSDVHWMKSNDKSRWFADPFILSIKEDTIIVLAEELSYSLDKGRIAKLIIDRRTWQLVEMKIILDLPTHLSFPMIFRRGEEVFIIPENSASGKSVGYLYDTKNDSLILRDVVCDEPLTDAIILKFNEDHYLLATSIFDPNGNEMIIYSFNPVTLEAKRFRTITFNRSIARNAGSPFKYNGALYRPAQDCDGAYGKGVVLQQITYNNNTKDLKFEEVSSIYPFSFKYHLGLHTLNVYDGMCVIDGRGLLHPFAGRIVRPIINTFRR